ncbi:flagellar hook-associated protein FlgK [Methylocaldum sp.]|uniref:flagellar hook-associated protein FlgK n=1 Tax=Methylocaldum sp. TaxID=1969727 RepID=UPI002D6565CB|nr:flagellar hook-associated protein FlgK [Methylocaldum sp.]HYE33910.1 flagellar hook-associated protein FlgK [Methylocaldum sp.]
MAGGLLGIATSGLMAAQRGLTTTGHNIANVNTEGYSRQRTEQVERLPSFTGAGFVGNGVDIASITRSYDSFLNTQLRSSLSTHAELETYHQMATQVDNFIADPDASLSPSLQSFFNSVQDVVNDPTSIAARRVMLTEGETLARRFNVLNDRMDDLRSQVNQNLSTNLDEINGLAKGIAALNERIVVAYGQAGKPPNDLLDQRNLLAEQLAQKVNTSLFEQKDGSLNVFIGSGQALVMGSMASQLSLQDSAYDPDQKDIAITVGGSSAVVITSAISGGEIGGLLRFGSEILDPAQNALGRIAVGLAALFNAQHSAGSDLNGNAGANFFTDVTNPAIGQYSSFNKQTNGGNAVLSIAFDNSAGNGPADLTATDYRLDYDGTDYTLTRLSDNTQFTNATGTFAVDGLSIGIGSGSAAANDSFLIRPFRRVAGDLAASLTDPREIAAAGSPFTGPGDNTNARALAQLQTTPSLLGGKATYQDAYNDIVGDVGTLTHAAEIDSTAQRQLLDHAKQARDSVSGVNLDEEAANLLRYQQAYQAAAQLIPAMNDMFDALIGAVRR